MSNTNDQIGNEFMESLEDFLIELMGQKEYSRIESLVSAYAHKTLKEIWTDIAKSVFGSTFFGEKELRATFLLFDGIFKSLTDRACAQRLMGLLLRQLIFEWEYEKGEVPLSAEEYARFIENFSYSIEGKDGEKIEIISPAAALVLVIYFFIIRAALITNSNQGAGSTDGTHLLNRYLPYMYGLGNILHMQMNSDKPGDSKYSIEAMIYKYNAMFQAFSYNPTLNQYFLTSEEIRRAMVTDGWIKFNEYDQPKKQFHLGQLVRPINKSELVNFLKFLRKMLFTQGEDPAKWYLDNILFWPGVGLKIPESARIALSFNNPYASFYYKSKSQNYDAGDNKIPTNIYIQEAPSSISFAISDSENVFINNTSLADIKKAGDEGFYDGVVDFSASGKDPNLRSVQGTISKSRLEDNAKGINNYEEFQFNIVPPANDDYELIVELPYLLPQLDVLAKTEITTNKDGKIETETIVLSSC